jgi:predicted metal-dependent peptidase
MTDVDTKLATSRYVACTVAEYLTHMIVGMIPKPMPGFGTFGVTEKAVMYYDPALVEQWTVEEIAAVLIHEAGHLIRDHAGRTKRAALHKGKANVNFDREINDDIVDMGLALPTFKHEGKESKCCMPSDIGCENGKTGEYYYANDPSPVVEVCMSGGGVGHGNCGGAAGNPQTGEPDDGSEPGRSEVDMGRIRQQVAAAAQAQAGKNPGSVPAGILRWAEEEIKPPKVSWKDKAGRAARTGIAAMKGCVDYSYTKPSRRQGALGYKAGTPVLPSMWAPRPRTAVCADTSGSMGTTEMTTVLSECNGIMQALGGDITFMACDAAVHSNREVRNWREILPLLKGGGGTDFVPMFEALAASQNRPNLAIIITDGCGPAPAAPPRGMRVIWLLIGQHRSKPSFAGEPFGEIIEIDDIAA